MKAAYAETIQILPRLPKPYRPGQSKNEASRFYIDSPPFSGSREGAFFGGRSRPDRAPEIILTYFTAIQYLTLSEYDIIVAVNGLWGFKGPFSFLILKDG